MVGIGETIGAYRILEQIGSGGMGTVYRAADTRLGREVALKFITDEVAAPEYVDRFRREARAASAINHPNICTLHDIGEYQDRPFLVLELLKGHTLTQRIQQGPIPSSEALSIVKQIADALDAAQRRGIVHRDIKPSNVFIPVEGPVKILDFGVAKLHSEPRGTARALEATEFETQVGSIVGTHGYMSPEQARGEDVDGRTDLFSLGVVLYEMLTGVKPFRGTSSAVVLDAILNRDPEPPSGINRAVPPPVDAIVARALEKDRTLRYQSAADLRADIERITRGSEPRKAAARIGRRRRLILALGVAALAGVVVGVVWWQSRVRPTPPSPKLEPSIQRLTANPWELPVTSSAISLDGKYVAYGDAQGIHVLVRQSGDVKLLANTSGMVAVSWLPDSTRILAALPKVLGRPSQQWVLSILGDRRPGSEDMPRVSPDGHRRLTVKAEASEASLPHFEFWVADANGDNSRRVASFDTPFISDFTWVDPWHVVFIEELSNSSPASALLCLDVRDGRTHMLVKSETPEMMLPTTLPEGRVLYVGSPNSSGESSELWELWVNKDSGELRSGPRQLTKFREQGIDAFSSTKDGKTILLQLSHSQADVYVGRLSSDDTHLSSPVRLTLDDRDDIPLAWMPDGRRVIFSSNRSGSYHIYTQAVDGPTAELLVAGEGDQMRPRVTPDKQWLLYTLMLPGSKALRLMRSPIEGGSAQELATGNDFTYRCGLHALCILEQMEMNDSPTSGGSPKSRRQVPTITTYRLDPISGRKVRLFNRRFGPPGVTVSPDGTQIAYLASSVAPDCHDCSQTPVLTIRIVSLTGTVQREVPLPITFRLPSLDWASDGRGFFVSGPFGSGPDRLCFVGLSGTVHDLWQTPAPHAGQLWAVPSPDGRYLAIRANTTESNLWAVEEPE